MDDQTILDRFVGFYSFFDMLGPRSSVTVRRRQQTYTLFETDPMRMVLGSFVRPSIDKCALPRFFVVVLFVF